MKKSIQQPEKYLNIHGWFDYESLYSGVIDKVKGEAHVVEVGCWLGRSACYMGELIKNSGKKVRFDCVDLWRHPRVDWSEHLIKGNKDTQVHDFVNNLHEAGVLDIVNVVQLSSLEAVNIYEDASLDFVFLDNDHTEEHVFTELNAWWPKIKKGGALAGHDYIPQHWPGVVNAVRRFTKAKKKKAQIVLNSYVITK